MTIMLTMTMIIDKDINIDYTDDRDIDNYDIIHYDIDD